MTRKVVLSNNPPASFHDNNGIIIQFILFELILAKGLIKQIHASLVEIGDASQKKTEKARQSSVHSIASAIIALAGSSQKPMRIFTSNLNEGILAQTKNYCAYFANNLDPKDPDSLHLQKNSSRAWTLSLDCLDLMRNLQQIPVKEIPDFSLFNHSFKRMSGRVEKLIEAVCHVLPQFQDDENVLWFLIAHRADLDRLFEKDFVLKLTDRMFPNGISEMERFLTQKYTERGFAHMIPLIKEKIEELESAFV